MALETGIWTEFSRELESRTVYFASELSNVWKDLAGLTEAQRGAFAAFENPQPRGERLESLTEFFANGVPALLADPLAVYTQKRPLQRSISAIEEHESALGHLLWRLPRVVELSGKEISELAGAAGPSLRLWRSVHRKQRAVRLRDSVSDHLQRMILSRAALDGAFQLLLAESALHLLRPWQACRRAFLADLVQWEGERVDMERARRRWMNVVDRHAQRAALLLGRYETWAVSAATSVAEALHRRPRPASANKRAKWEHEHQKHMSFWSRQQRAVRSVIDLELHVAGLARATNRETTASLEALGYRADY